MNSVLASLELRRTDDVFALRHCGRDAAAAIGLDEADQVRLATALSELGRQALSHSKSATAVFHLAADGALTVDVEGIASSAPDLGAALQAARRLVSDLTVTDGTEGDLVSIRLVKRPPHGYWPERDAVEAAIRSSLSSGPLEDLRVQNHDLIAALEELRAGQEQLLRVNEELEETNRGVLAMYAQLSDELEETNRGVVALYAELDGKGMQLKEASDSKSRFLASISHELRSPINSIVGLVRLLQDEVPASLADEQKIQLGYIDEAALRLLQLVDDLLDLAKAESGHLQPAMTDVALPDVFAELRGAIRPLLQSGVELVIDAPRIETLYTDHSLLVQMLRNLLSNAAKFTEAGRVELTAAEGDAGEVTISVSDTGVGIAPEEQVRVFEDFYQVRGPLQKRHKGTGLGLGYSRKVAHALGGEMVLKSIPGVGSEFLVSLPAGRPSKEAQALPVLPPNRLSGGLLIVDDDPAFRLTLRTHLAGLGLQVGEADGGLSALVEIRRAKPDAIFLDLAMPDMSGPELIEILAADPRYRDIPIVVVTSADSGSREPVPRAVGIILKSELTRDAVAGAVESIRLGNRR